MTTPSRACRLTLLATALGSSLAFLDLTVVVVALPRMEEDLDLGLAGQQWVYLAYALSLAAFYLLSGAIGDRVGLRRTFIGGVVLFAGASLVCAVAPTEGALLAGRALQGVGGAALTTTSLALLRVVWAGQAARAIGLWTSLTSVAMVAGPLLGGLLVQVASWRWIFLLNLPLAVVAIVFAAAGRSDEERTSGRSTLDIVGAILSSVGLTGLAFSLVEVGDHGAAVVPAAVVGCVSLAAFIVWTLRAPDRLVPPRLLRTPGIAAANVVTMVLYAGFTAQLVFLPVYLQFLGVSPTATGLVFVVPSIALVALAPRWGAFADRRGPRLPVAAGGFVIAASTLLLLPVTAESDVPLWIGASLIAFGLGLSAVVAPITAAALAPAPSGLAGVASGLNQTVTRVGAVFSVAAVGAVASAVFVAAGGDAASPFELDLPADHRDAAVMAFRVVAMCIGALCALGAVLAAILLPSGSVSQRDALEPEQLDLAPETTRVADEIA
jgi:EmrB/QacA subfamily drug resistance transporter